MTLRTFGECRVYILVEHDACDNVTHGGTHVAQLMQEFQVWLTLRHALLLKRAAHICIVRHQREHTKSYLNHKYVINRTLVLLVLV